jgi:hypothetical protein
MALLLQETSQWVSKASWVQMPPSHLDVSKGSASRVVLEFEVGTGPEGELLYR